MQNNIVFNVSSRFFIIGIDKFPHKLKLYVNENMISYKTKKMIVPKTLHIFPLQIYSEQSFNIYKTISNFCISIYRHNLKFSN